MPYLYYISLSHQSKGFLIRNGHPPKGQQVEAGLPGKNAIKFSGTGGSLKADFFLQRQAFQIKNKEAVFCAYIERIPDI